MATKKRAAFCCADKLPVLLQLEEVAAMLNKGYDTVRKWAKNGDLPAAKIEDVWRVDTQAFCEMFRRDAKQLYWEHTPRFLSIGEFAELYRVSYETARVWANNGKLPAAKFKDTWMIDAALIREMFVKNDQVA